MVKFLGNGAAVVAGIHKEGKPYGWPCAAPAISLTYDELRFPRGVIKPGVDCTQNTQIADHGVQDGEVFTQRQPPAGYATFEAVLVATALTGEGQTFQRMFKTVRGIKGLEVQRGSPFKQPKLDELFEQWHQWNKKHLRESKEHYKIEFMGRYFCAKYPLGGQQMLSDLWQRVITDPLPPEIQALPLTPELKLTAALRKALQRIASLAGRRTFHLSGYTMARLFGHANHSTCAYWFLNLRHYRVIELAIRGSQGQIVEGFRRKASEYIYLLPQ